MNARCNSFENKYRILAQQRLKREHYNDNMGSDFKIENKSNPSSSLGRMKNKLEGMHLKSTFAQKFYNNQVVPVYNQGEYIE